LDKALLSHVPNVARYLATIYSLPKFVEEVGAELKPLDQAYVYTEGAPNAWGDRPGPWTLMPKCVQRF
jgi:hypothetical protein